MLRAQYDDDVDYHEIYLGEGVVGCCLFDCKFDDGLLSHMGFEILNLYNGVDSKGEMRLYQSWSKYRLQRKIPLAPRSPVLAVQGCEKWEWYFLLE
jgi:hypothetical protein